MTDTDTIPTVTIGTREYNAWELAREADCGSPDTRNSAGARFLIHVAREVEENLRYYAEQPDIIRAMIDGDNDDMVHEIADSAPDVYTHVMWSEFVDLCAYQEDPDEMGWAGDDMEGRARVCLYLIAQRLVCALIDELRDQRDAAEADEG